MELIKAIQPQNSESHWVFTPLDKACLGMVIRGTWFFKSRTDEVVLMNSLGHLLHYYPHLAGRMTSNDSIELNNAGVPFSIKEELRLTMKDALNIKNPIHRFSSGLRLTDLKKGRIAPLSICLTHIADGTILSVYCSHACMDGNSFYTMMENWGKLSCYRPITIPILDQSLFPAVPDVTRQKMVEKMQFNKWKTVGLNILFQQLHQSIKGISRERTNAIYFSDYTIQKIKQSIVKNSGINYGTHVALSAFVTKMCLNLSHIDTFVPCSQISVTDIRNRIKSLPADFVGNAVSNLVTSGFTPSSSITEIAGKINTSLQTMFEGEGQNLEEFVKMNLYAMQHKLPYVPFDITAMNDKNPTCIYINNLLKFPIYDLDFGFGKPYYIVPHDLPDQVRFWPGTEGTEVYFTGYIAKKYNKIKDKEGWINKLLKQEEIT